MVQMWSYSNHLKIRGSVQWTWTKTFLTVSHLPHFCLMVFFFKETPFIFVPLPSRFHMLSHREKAKSFLLSFLRLCLLQSLSLSGLCLLFWLRFNRLRSSLSPLCGWSNFLQGYCRNEFVHFVCSCDCLCLRRTADVTTTNVSSSSLSVSLPLVHIKICTVLSLRYSCQVCGIKLIKVNPYEKHQG